MLSWTSPFWCGFARAHSRPRFSTSSPPMDFATSSTPLELLPYRFSSDEPWSVSVREVGWPYARRITEPRTSVQLCRTGASKRSSPPSGPRWGCRSGPRGATGGGSTRRWRTTTSFCWTACPSSTTRRRSGPEQIEVLWLKGRAIQRAFEVEHTTSIYSGILRMADLLTWRSNPTWTSGCTSWPRSPGGRRCSPRSVARVLAPGPGPIQPWTLGVTGSQLLGQDARNPGAVRPLPGSLPRSRVAPEGSRNRGLPEELHQNASRSMASGQPLSLASLSGACRQVGAARRGMPPGCG
jgi:hypothetical protein